MYVLVRYRRSVERPASRTGHIVRRNVGNVFNVTFLDHAKGNNIWNGNNDSLALRCNSGTPIFAMLAFHGDISNFVLNTLPIRDRILGWNTKHRLEMLNDLKEEKIMEDCNKACSSFPANVLLFGVIVHDDAKECCNTHFIFQERDEGRRRRNVRKSINLPSSHARNILSMSCKQSSCWRSECWQFNACPRKDHGAESGNKQKSGYEMRERDDRKKEENKGQSVTWSFSLFLMSVAHMHLFLSLFFVLR